MASTASSSSNGSATQLFRDGSVGAGLVGAIVVVFLFDLSTKPSENNETVSNPVVSTVTEPEPVPLKIAVTEPEFDDMGGLLTSLGSGFRFSTIDVGALVNESTLNNTDVLFLTCGGVPNSWVEKVIGAGERGQSTVTVKEEVYDRAKENLRRFVNRGGTLYASDQRFHFIADAFPDVIGSTSLGKGDKQTVNANVVDSGLSGLVGERIQLQFDKPGWTPAAFDEEKVTALIRGSFRGMDGNEYRSPLLVRFKIGEGFVIFTSFHNEKVNGEVAAKLLRYLVFATVLAKTEEKSEQITTSGGLVAKGRSLLSASSAAPSVTQLYKCTKAGPLRFVLGFDDRGARIKLTVVSPSGQKHEKEGTSTFQIDIPDASTGDWKYTITALKMPYDNFPYSLSIGAK